MIIYKICFNFIELLETTNPTHIISPSHNNFICFQYSKKYSNKFTRPLNTDLFIENSTAFEESFSNFIEFCEDIKTEKVSIVDNVKWKEYLALKELLKIIYTLQQSIGSIGDSFDNPNQSRNRVGQLFENLVKLIIRKVGITCESRVVKIPIPGHEDYTMKYDLDLVFSRNAAVIASETRYTPV